MKRIFLVCYLNKNLGDDLFIEIIKNRFSKNYFCCLAYSNVDIEYYKNRLDVDCWKYSYLYRAIDKITYLVFGKRSILKWVLSGFHQTIYLGGSIFQEAPGWRNSVRFIKEIYSYSKEFNVIGANFGPYKDEYYKYSYYQIFKLANSITFREKYSKNLFEELNNVRYRPDAVFSLPDKYINFGYQKRKKVCFSIIDFDNRNNLKHFEKTYIEYVSKLIVFFINKGYVIQLMSFCEPEGDVKGCLKVVSYLDGKLDKEMINQIKIYNYDGDIKETLREIKESEYLVGCRFHSIILGWILKVKTFPMIYSDKTLNVIKDICPQVPFYDIRDHKDFEFENYDEYFTTLNNLEVLRKEAEEQFLCLL